MPYNSLRFLNVNAQDKFPWTEFICHISCSEGIHDHSQTAGHIISFIYFITQTIFELATCLASAKDMLFKAFEFNDRKNIRMFWSRDLDVRLRLFGTGRIYETEFSTE